jgi:manganese-dependent inorganic pyrophosphatase
MISLSLPAREVMETDIPVLTFDDTLAHAREVVSSSEFRAACVVAGDGTLAGILTRTTLLDEVKKSVILLDHNEAAQAPEGIDDAEIVEIIDHHRLGAITTLKPVKFLNDPVGATSTLIAMKFMESGLEPSRAVAGALLSGILSDTLSLRTSTTTHRDTKAVKFLAPLAGVDPEELGTALLERSMDLDGVGVDELLARDMKEYEIAGVKLIIAQLMVPSSAWNRERDGIIFAGLRNLRERSGLDLALALFTDVLANASDLYASGDPALVKKVCGGRLPVRLDGMMSRKKDFLPWIGAKLKDRARG